MDHICIHSACRASGSSNLSWPLNLPTTEGNLILASSGETPDVMDLEWCGCCGSSDVSSYRPPHEASKGPKRVGAAQDYGGGTPRVVGVNPRVTSVRCSPAAGPVSLS